MAEKIRVLVNSLNAPHEESGPITPGVRSNQVLTTERLRTYAGMAVIPHTEPKPRKKETKKVNPNH